jgi:hypothetical protein
MLCFVIDVLFIGGDRTFDSRSNTRSHMLLEALPVSDINTPSFFILTGMNVLLEADVRVVFK